MSGVGAVILAAGASTRLGAPKQLIMIGDENLLDRSVRVAAEAKCSPIIVVLGAFAELIVSKSNLTDVQVIFNPTWDQGMSGSIRTGVEALPEVQGAVIMTCDMPAVTSNHLRALTASREPTATSYAGRHGVPAYLPKSMFSSLVSLQGDRGARDLLQRVTAIELPGGELDIDTADDVKVALERYG